MSGRQRGTAAKCHGGEGELSSTHARTAKTTTTVIVGIDFAKNASAVHGIHGAGKPDPIRPKFVRGPLHDEESG
jgi:hypothetical protein